MDLHEPNVCPEDALVGTLNDEGGLPYETPREMRAQAFIDAAVRAGVIVPGFFRADDGEDWPVYTVPEETE
jgi:hypothetical protein